MTPRERVMAVLHGDMPDRVPFTCSATLLPRGQTERQLREQGLALKSGAAVYTTTRRNVEFERREQWRDGRLFIRQTYHTPVGAVTELLRTGGGYDTSLRCEFPIKRAEDYEVVEFMVRDEVYEPCYDSYLAEAARMGEDGLVHSGPGYSPLMEMLVYLLGHERWALDMVDHPREFFGLYDLLTERRREQYELCANSPCPFFRYGGNVTSEMMGRKRFVNYCVPCYNEFAELLHAHGKLMYVHFDGNIKVLAEAIADSQIDCIEAFSAFPDGDLPIEEARRIWSDKIIWTTFPSPLHLRASEEIEAYCHHMLRAVAPGDRFLVGVTENIPDEHWQRSMTTISRVLGEHGKLPLEV